MIEFPFSVQPQASLKNWTTLEIGGSARWLLEAKDLETLQKALHFCFKENISYYIVGKGSNLLFDDQGFEGLVIVNKIHAFEELSPGIFKASGGYSFSRLGTKTATLGYAGLEFAAGIPASVGGAVFMNAGAGKDETAHSLLEVEWLSPEGVLHRFKREELHFSYRESSFQDWKGAVVSATFQLKPDAQARERQKELIAYRERTQPYGDRSAGCVFRNPVGTSAGSLIDRMQLKGYAIGGCEVSTMHANFLINRHNATSKDFLQMIHHIQQKAKENLQIELIPEIRIAPLG